MHRTYTTSRKSSTLLFLHPSEPPVEPEGRVALKTPDETWTVSNIKAWLDSEGIAYTSSMTKAQLLELVV